MFEKLVKLTDVQEKTEVEDAEVQVASTHRAALTRNSFHPDLPDESANGGNKQQRGAVWNEEHIEPNNKGEAGDDNDHKLEEEGEHVGWWVGGWWMNGMKVDEHDEFRDDGENLENNDRKEIAQEKVETQVASAPRSKSW